MSDHAPPPCRFAGEHEPRVVKGRHVDPLPDDHDPGCESCLPCTEPHCAVDGHRHVTDRKVCPTCLAETKQDLRDIVTLHATLRTQAYHLAHKSSAPDRLPPGGEAMVHLGPYSAAALTRDDEIEAECDEHALHTLATWSDVYREWWNDAGPKATVEGEADYLTQHLHTMAELGPREDAEGLWFPPEFPEMVRDIRAARARLENVLHAGDRDETGAPCPMCGDAKLVKDYGAAQAKRCECGLRPVMAHADHARCDCRPRLAVDHVHSRIDLSCRACHAEIEWEARHAQHVVALEDARWHCPKCDQWWTETDYRAKVDGDYLDVADELTASDLHRAYRVPVGSVHGWAALGKVTRCGKDQRGRQLYDVASVLAMRDRRAS